jgi:hypothetical protein
MNSPFIIAQAKNLVNRADFKAASTDQQRLHLLYQLAYQRDPSREEIKWARQFTDAARALHPGPDVWQKYAQVILMSNELVFVD